VILLH